MGSASRLVQTRKAGVFWERSRPRSLEMKEKLRTGLKAIKSIDKVFNEFPAFADIFDEETWYQLFFVFTCCTFVCVFILSRYITLRSNDPLDREHRGVKKANPRSARQPLGKEEIKED